MLTQKEDADDDAEQSKTQGTLPWKGPETAEDIAAIEAASELRRHPRIPALEGNTREYAIQPVPVHQPVRREAKDLSSNRGKLGETLTVMARPNKRAWKPYAVSVAGRTINVNTGP